MPDLKLVLDYSSDGRVPVRDVRPRRLRTIARRLGLGVLIALALLAAAVIVTARSGDPASGRRHQARRRLKSMSSVTAIIPAS
jgi:hypothetical protein